MRSCVILTTYNRPRLVQDCIASLREQTDQDFRAIIMDDGCSEESRRAIGQALENWRTTCILPDEALRQGMRPTEDAGVVWYQGPDRSAAERKRTISYSRSINIALNFLLQDERLITYVCDDDALYPEAIQARADYLDTNPDAHVCWGRSRSIQYDKGGFNKWANPAAPLPGRRFPRPTGPRELLYNGGAAKTYFENGETDPETGLSYVEEAFWQPGQWWYGRPFHHDHNQVMHRRECLTQCRGMWFGAADAGGIQYWGEDLEAWAVGDKAFFTLLGQVHPFHAVDAWCVTKVYHDFSDGRQTGDVRE